MPDKKLSEHLIRSSNAIRDNRDRPFSQGREMGMREFLAQTWPEWLCLIAGCAVVWLVIGCFQ